VAGHKEPDGDCVGSQLALCSALRRLGKEAVPCSAGPFKRAEAAVYADRFLSAPGPGERGGARVLLTDCSGLSRTGDLAPFLKGLPLGIIDHHAVGDGGGPGEGPVLYNIPEAPSTTCLVLRIIRALGLELAGEEAGLLFLGLCTDTGFFRHVDRGGELAFDAASALVRAGASPKEAFRAMHGGKSLNSRLLLGLLLSRLSSHFEGRLLLTFEEYEDTRRFGLEGRDSDSLYQLLQSVGGVEAAAVIRQEKPDNCTVGLRSRDRVDVAALAARFGGGGHRNAAGFSMAGTIAGIRPLVIDAFSAFFYDICHKN
jgi:phosphoesterase RecJ-like protein